MHCAVMSWSGRVDLLGGFSLILLPWPHSQHSLFSTSLLTLMSVSMALPLRARRVIPRFLLPSPFSERCVRYAQAAFRLIRSAVSLWKGPMAPQWS